VERLQVEGDEVARLLRLATEWKSEHEARMRKAENAIVEFQQERADEILQQQTKRAEAERIKHLPIQAILAMPIADIQRAFDVSDVKTARGNFEAKCRIPAAPRTIHPAVTFMKQLQQQQQLNASTILWSLTPELKQQLQKFLRAVKLNVTRTTYDAAWARCRTNIAGCSRFGCVMRSSSVSDAQDQPEVLYKATRDGFSPSPLYRCVAQQGPTLTLIKVSPHSRPDPM
jgi:hypothetical protein